MAQGPVPTAEIVTDPEVHAAYDAAVDGWALSISLAAGRICRWSVRMGAEWDFCPPPPAGPQP
ncbi:hypothetical protein [Altericroceibacterium endophyticum]|uniref:Uncharacterized protein n=1 Tax=Altericroceibacterium endophyticum TaxID=1808508 RepID=A0A6I4T112_9SPHN|nr:hypothetical protein [Altericroceibacterium endophyticum]MXO64844.1 hypothetical protein [Altericroceibacterium endophyticum]